MYGKEATAYYDLHQGLRYLTRGGKAASPVPCVPADAIVSELEEFAAAVRGLGAPEMDGVKGTRSLAVVLAGIRSAREGRKVTVAEMMEAA